MFGSHHFHRREPHPKPNVFVFIFEKIMYGIALISPLALTPQIVEIFSSKDVSGLSLLSWSMLTGINLLWIIYGSIHKIVPLLIANFLFCALNLAGVIGILLYS